MAGRLKPGIPGIANRPRQRMAVIRVEGDPNTESQKYLPALYSTVYGLRKTAGKFKVEKLRARWPGIKKLPKTKWVGLYALPVPDNTDKLPSQNKVPGAEVKLEDWDYGEVAPNTPRRPL